MRASLDPVHICLRQTVDWGDEAAFRAQLAPAFAAKVDAWNATFSLPYHLFRQELRAIAQANLEQVEGAVLCSWQEVPDGGLVAPVDDDDWFAPQLVGAIRSAVGSAVVGLRWRQSVLEVPINACHRLRLLQRSLMPWIGPKWLCATNSYIIRKGCVDARCFTSHVAASRWFAQLQPERIRVLPHRLSLHNRSLASITSLNYGRPTISRLQLLRRAHSYNALYRHGPMGPEELAWCRPAVLRMENLMVRLNAGGVV